MTDLSLETLELLWEDAYIQDVGKVRSEIGEVEEIYDDYEFLSNKVQEIETKSKIDLELVRKQLERAMQFLAKIEAEMRAITKTGKEPRRTPIKQLELTGNLKRDIDRVSADIGSLAVRIRNIGQAMADVTKVDVGAIRSQLEKVYLITRKAFVLFEKEVGG